jgi:predicted Zn finger-like uncharacterized protein
MRYSDSYREPIDRSSPAVVSETPVSCPSCASSSIVTTAKSPDANSYWRCKSCGEIWNGARFRPSGNRGGAWR